MTPKISAPGVLFLFYQYLLHDYWSAVRSLFHVKVLRKNMEASEQIIFVTSGASACK
jgi:hypothetical protein